MFIFLEMKILWGINKYQNLKLKWTQNSVEQIQQFKILRTFHLKWTDILKPQLILNIFLEFHVMIFAFFISTIS
jgi:hypothetical protein